MTSVLIVFDTEDINDEFAENWVDTMIEKRLITASVVSKVLINNKIFLERDDIFKLGKQYIKDVERENK